MSVATARESRTLLVLGVLGALGHLAMGAWYALSTLVAPWPAVLGLLLIWVLLTVFAWRLWRVRPAWLLLLPLLDAVVWLTVISAGESLLGWTA